jgi:hypothetical protein
MPHDKLIIDSLGVNVYAPILPALSRPNIGRIARNHDGKRAPTAEVLYHDLRQFGFKSEDIKDLAAMREGVVALEALQETWRPLTRFGFDHREMVTIAGCGGGAALRAVRKSYEQCTARAFSKGDVVTIAARPGGAQALPTVVELHDKLTSCGYSKADIMLLCRSRFAGDLLKIIVDQHEALESCGLGKDDILEISRGPRALTVLTAALGITKSRPRPAWARPIWGPKNT